MDSKRDLDGEKRLIRNEKRLIRNEKARRRRALQYACRYLPIELEKEVFSYMRPYGPTSCIDVSMTWQTSPVARLFKTVNWDIFRVCRIISTGVFDGPCLPRGAIAADQLAGKHNLQTNVARLIARDINDSWVTDDSWAITGRRLRKITTTFTLHMLRNIADKAIRMIDPVDRPYSAQLVVWRRGLQCDLEDWEVAWLHLDNIDLFSGLGVPPSEFL